MGRSTSSKNSPPKSSTLRPTPTRSNLIKFPASSLTNETRLFSLNAEGHIECEEGRVLRLAEREDLKEDHHRRLRPVLGSMREPLKKRRASIFDAASVISFLLFWPHFCTNLKVQ